jgi:5-methyltetrahydrofolate--homocysteine methyltransferase
MVLEQISEALQEGNSAEVSKLVKAAIDQKVQPQDILNKGLIDGMSKIGAKFKCNEVYVPEVLMSARAMHAGLAVLKPLLAAKGIKPRGTVVIGTVRGDLHDIGKNLVGMMLQGAGFAVTDLGNDVSPEKFIEAVQKEGAQVVGLSALLTTTMPNMKEVIAKFVETGLRKRVKIMVGGAPLTAEYAKEIGADGYAPDAAEAADLALALVPV